eukprot:403356368
MQILNRKFYEVFVPRVSLSNQIFNQKERVFIMEEGSIKYLTAEILRNQDQNMISWENLLYKQVNFEYNIDSLWQKTIQVNDTDVYFLAGAYCITGTRVANICYRLNIRYNTIEKIANLNEGRYGSGYCHLNNKIYLMGGAGPGGKGTSCEVYDIEKNKWNYFTPFPVQLSNPTAVTFGERFIYLIGGRGIERQDTQMSEIMRIDTLQPDQDLKWERIKFQQSGEGSILKIKGGPH